MNLWQKNLNLSHNFGCPAFFVSESESQYLLQLFCASWDLPIFANCMEAKKETRWGCFWRKGCLASIGMSWVSLVETKTSDCWLRLGLDLGLDLVGSIFSLKGNEGETNSHWVLADKFEQNPCCLLYMWDYTTQLYTGSIISHYQDTYEPIRIMECCKGFERCSPNFFFAQLWCLCDLCATTSSSRSGTGGFRGGVEEENWRKTSHWFLRFFFYSTLKNMLYIFDVVSRGKFLGWGNYDLKNQLQLGH